jgi:hypothetical protein
MSNDSLLIKATNQLLEPVRAQFKMLDLPSISPIRSISTGAHPLREGRRGEAYPWPDHGTPRPQFTSDLGEVDL